MMKVRQDIEQEIKSRGGFFFMILKEEDVSKWLYVTGKMDAERELQSLEVRRIIEMYFFF